MQSFVVAIIFAHFYLDGVLLRRLSRGYVFCFKKIDVIKNETSYLSKCTIFSASLMFNF